MNSVIGDRVIGGEVCGVEDLGRTWRGAGRKRKGERKIDSSKTSGLGTASRYIPIAITAFRKEGQIHERGLTMSAGPRDPEPQFENPEASKLEDETRVDTPQKQMDRVAEKLAQKSTKIEQQADKNQSIFTK
jgi:hypothetical protein